MVVHRARVQEPEPFRLNLHDVRVGVLLPEPFGTAALDIAGIDFADLLEAAQESSAGAAVFETHGDVGDPVFDGVADDCARQRLDMVRVFLAGVTEMAETALEGEAKGQRAERFDQAGDRAIQSIGVQFRKASGATDVVVGIDDHRFDCGECLHGFPPPLSVRQRAAGYDLSGTSGRARYARCSPRQPDPFMVRRRVNDGGPPSRK